MLMGRSIKYVTLFLANFNPLPCHTLSHISGLPKSRPTSHISEPPIFSWPCIQQTRTIKPPVQNISQLFAGDFVRGVCQGAFCLGGFFRGGFCPFPLLSEYICYNRKLNITLNFIFHMYDKFFYKCDVTCS